MNTALYAGTFDPVTLGHLDVITRAAKQFDKLIVAVVDTPTHKNTWLTTDERIDLVKLAVQDRGISNVEVVPFKGLLVEVAKKADANVLIRGLRAVSDFEYEQSMAHANRSLDENIETFFILCQPEYSFISSSLIREVAKNDGQVKQWLDQTTHNKLMEMEKIK